MSLPPPRAWSSLAQDVGGQVKCSAEWALSARKSSASHDLWLALAGEGSSQILILRHSNGDLNLGDTASAILSFLDRAL